MNDTSKIFKKEFDEWLKQNTIDLPGSDSFNCPVCDDYAGEDYHLVQCFNDKSNVAVSMNTGPFDAFDWIELRQCENPKCNSFFTVDNSNY